MDVSIIILNYNTFEYTCQCIQSVIDNTLEVTYEIILVDNASVECDADLFKEKFPLIKLIKSDKNLGFSKGCNLGLTHAIGSTFLLLNSDVKLIEDSISKCFKLLNQQSDVLMVGPKTIDEKGLIRPICEAFPSIKNELIKLFRLTNFLSNNYKKNNLFYNFSNYNEDFIADWIYGSFLLFKKETLLIFENIKLPDTFFMYGEDMEWAYCIYKNDKKVMFTSKTSIIHYGGKSTYFNPDLNLNMIFNNEIIFLRKYFTKTSFKLIVILKSLNSLTRLNFKLASQYLREF